MGYREPTIDDVKVTVSIRHKRNIAPKGKVFFIAKVVDEHKKMTYTIHQLVDRSQAEPHHEFEFKQLMKQRLIEQVKNKA